MNSSRGPKLNLNTATEEELAAIPAIGRVTARRIIATRQSGPFNAVSDLLRVRGLSQATYDQVADLFLVEAGGDAPAASLTPISFGPGEAVQPLHFYGTPRQLTGAVPLANLGDRQVRLNAITLDGTDLRTPSGAAMTEVPMRRWLQPGEQVGALMALALDPRTPPGTYEAAFVLGDQRQPVVFHVAEVVRLRVVPERLVLDNRPGGRTTKTLFITNEGNVNISIGDVGIVGLEETNLICNTIRHAVSQVKDPDWDTTVASFVNTLNRSFQESRALTVRTRGKPIRIPPGETVSVELTFSLPRTLRPRRRYFGIMRLYNAAVSITLEPMATGDESEPSDEGPGVTHEA